MNIPNRVPFLFKRVPQVLGAGALALISCVLLGAGEARAQAVEDDVVINEYAANATAGREYVELLVVKPGGVDMRGWTISDTSSRTAAASATEGDISLPLDADYLSLVPQGTHVVIVGTIGGAGASTPAQDLSNDDGNRKLVLLAGSTPGVVATSSASPSAPFDISTNDNVQLYAGPRATGTIIDQVLAGSNQQYVEGARWGDNSGSTTSDNVDGDNNSATNQPAAGTVPISPSALPGGGIIRFVPGADSQIEFRNNDTGSKYQVDAATYGTPGAANTGVTEASLNPALNSIQFEAALFRAPEGGTATLAVTRPAGSTGAVSVPFTVTSGTATVGSDFPSASASGTFSFAAGEIRATVQIALPDDSILEDNETLSLQLGTPSAGATLGEQTTATLLITENDRAPLLLLNEAKADDLGADEPYEFIEVRGTPGASLGSVFVLAINNGGVVGRAFDLSGFSLGSNGLAIIKSSVASPLYTIPAETTIIPSPALSITGGLGNGALTFVLALLPPSGIVEGSDLDANNDGALELPTGTQVIDSIGYKNVAADIIYGPELIALGPQTTPSGTADAPDGALEAITRFPGDTSTSAAAWYGGALAGNTATSNAYDTAQPQNLTPNFPLGGAVTPGDANVPAPPANAPPDAVDDSFIVDEDSGANTLQVLGNDTDPDAGAVLTVTAVTQGTNGGAVAIGTNSTSVTYSPAANATGTDTFTYTISDGQGASDTATVTITITPINDAPTFAPIADQTVAEDAPAQTIQITDVSPGGASDENGQDVTFSATSSDTSIIPNPTITGTGGTRTLSFRPAANRSGAVTITVRATDAGSNTAPNRNFFERTFTITVTPVNDAPDAVDDSFTFDEDAPAQTLQVLGNDLDLDEGDTRRVDGITQGSKGTVAIGQNGANVIYTPNADANGSDTFTYTISDGAAFDTATVTILITPVNDAPSGASDAYTVSNNSSLSVSAPGVLDNDVDVENQALSAALVAGSGPANGDLTLNANGSFSYDPDDNFVGSDAFSYRASDGTAQSAPIVVTIQVTQGPNSAPTISAIADQSTLEDTATGPISFTVGDAQTPPANLEVTTTSSNLSLVPQPSISLGGSGASRTISISPAPNQNGTATITVKVSDGALSAERTFTITVEAQNDAPTITAPDNASTTEDSSVVFSAATSNALRLADVDAPSSGLLDLSLSLQTSNGTSSGTLSGTLSLSQISGLSSPSGGAVANGGASIQARGTLANLNAALDGLRARPNANFNGALRLSITINDRGQSGGAAQSASDTIALQVLGVNDAPVAQAQSVGTDEDTPLAIMLTASDVDNASLTFSIVTAPTRGTLSRSGAASGPGLVYTPSANFAGRDSFSFRASDGAAESEIVTVSITVGGQNDAPVAVADTASTSEDVPVSLQVLGNDLDADGDTLRVVRVATTSATRGTVSINANGTLLFVPEPNFSGPSTFAYTIADAAAGSTGGLESSAQVTVQVLAVNDAPVALSQSVSTREETPLAITLGAQDVDSAALTFSIITPPQNGTLTGSGASRRYVPRDNFSGQDSFSFRASDGALESQIATVTISVGGDNDGPIALDDSASTLEDTPLVIRVLANDRDVDGDALRVVRVSGLAAAQGTVSINADGTLRFVPALNFNGPSAFSYTISDGTAQSTARVSVSVRAVNDAPIARDDRASVRAGESVAVRVLANDADPEGDAFSISALVASADGAATFGTISLSADRRAVIFAPQNGFTSGDTAFSYTIRNSGGSSTARVRVEVLLPDNPGTPGATPVPPGTPGGTPGGTPIPPAAGNRAPVALRDSYSTRGPLSVARAGGVLSNDRDADGQALSAFVSVPPRHGSVRLGADGSFVYTPSIVFSGRDSFFYVAFDGRSQSAPAEVTIAVAAPRDVTAPFVGLAGGDERAMRALIPARGVAADVYATREGIVVTSGLRGVAVQLQNQNGQFWNGRAFQAAPFNLPVVLRGRSFFVQPSATPTRSQATDGRYKWTAIATDNAGNIARATQIIQLDSTSPTLLVTSPGAPDAGAGIARVSNLSRLSGQAKGASRVEVALRRADGSYWNGEAYQAEPIFLDATLDSSQSGAWSLDELPAGSDLPLGRYTIIVRARDEVGNSSTISRQVVLASIAAS